jgi:hypothetical protein
MLAVRGQNRAWHVGHLLMALGMAAMYLPASIVRLGIPAGDWQLVFTNATAVVLAWMVARVATHRAVHLIWMTTLADFAAMSYMWHAGGYAGAATWVLAAYCAGQAVLWLTGTYDRIDAQWQTGGTDSPALAAPGLREAHGALVLRPGIVVLRPTMIAMSAGMAWMLVAMQQMH